MWTKNLEAIPSYTEHDLELDTSTECTARANHTIFSEIICDCKSFVKHTYRVIRDRRYHTSWSARIGWGQGIEGSLIELRGTHPEDYVATLGDSIADQLVNPSNGLFQMMIDEQVGIMFVGEVTHALPSRDHGGCLRLCEPIQFKHGWIPTVCSKPMTTIAHNQKSKADMKIGCQPQLALWWRGKDWIDSRGATEMIIHLLK